MVASLTTNESLLDLRPKFRRDVIFLPVQEGVMFRHGGGMFIMKGSSLYSFVSKLFVLFDGSRTVGDICSQLDPARAKHAAALLEGLWSRGVLHEHIQKDEEVLAQPVREHFERQLAFIEHYTNRPAAQFHNFRSARVLLCGEGPAMVSLGAALLRNGMEEVVLTSASGEADLVPLQTELAELEAAGIPARYLIRPKASVEAFDIVAYASTRPDLRAVMNLNERCRAAGIAFLPAIVVGQRSYLGPLVTSESSACWCCALLRLSSSGEERPVDLWRSVSLGEELANPLLADCATGSQILGTNAAFEIFKYRCGHLAPETAGAVICQSLETLESKRVPLLTHLACPLCNSKGASAASVPDLTNPAPKEDGVEERSLFAALDPYIHPQFGIVQKLGGEEASQVPLRFGSVVFTMPESGAIPEIVYGFDIDTTAAAMRSALVEAVRRYSGACPASPLFMRGSLLDLDCRDARPVRSEDLLSWCGPGISPDDSSTWMRACSLRDKTTRLVPAGAVFPMSRHNSGCFRRMAVCVTTGESFGSILDQGIERALAYDRLASFPANSAILEHSPGALRTLGTDVEFLVTSLGRFNHSARLVELTGPTPVSLVVAFIEDKPLSAGSCVVGFGSSLHDAAKMALGQLLGSIQLDKSPMDANCSLAGLFPQFPVEALLSGSPGDHHSIQGSASTSELLASAGFEALLVDVTPPDVKATGALLSGVFLLMKAAS